MTKIKNDPGRYVTRSSLSGRMMSVATEKEKAGRVRTPSDYRDAHIDDGMYVTFRIKERETR